jgi:hypothetical protein
VGFLASYTSHTPKESSLNTVITGPFQISEEVELERDHSEVSKSLTTV